MTLATDSIVPESARGFAHRHHVDRGDRKEHEHDQQSVIQIGQEIMNWDRREAYGADWNRVADASPDLVLPPPGYLGHRFRRVVFLDSNPSSAPDRRATHREWDRLFERWRDEGTLEAYDDAFNAYLEYFPTLRYWPKWVVPILDSAGIGPGDICYLNLSKSVMRGNKQPTVRIRRADWRWTRKQLELLEPLIVVAGGKGVCRDLKKLWPDHALRVAVQDRSRGQTSDAMNDRARQIGRQIKEALATSE